MYRIKLRPLMIVVAAVVVLLAAVGIVTARQHQNGTLQVILNLPDTDSVSLELNNTKQDVSGLRPTYVTKRGSYHMVVTKPGYQSFSADFVLATNQTTTVNVVMARTSTPSTANLPANVTSDLQITGLTIGNTTYFDSKTWAFSEIQTTDGNTGFIVARYDDTTKQWKLAQGPGTSFSEDTLDQIPADVAAYMRQNNYVSEEAFDE